MPLGSRAEHRITVVKGQYSGPEAQWPHSSQQPVGVHHFDSPTNSGQNAVDAQSLIELPGQSICRQAWLSRHPIPNCQCHGSLALTTVIYFKTFLKHLHYVQLQGFSVLTRPGTKLLSISSVLRHRFSNSKLLPLSHSSPGSLPTL